VHASEQAQEREMILQATGIAEARTRLFRSPSDLQSAIGNLGASAASRGSDSKIRSIPKLEDANWAGGKRAHELATATAKREEKILQYATYLYMMAKVKAVKKDQIFDHIRAEQRAMTRARCSKKKKKIK
jgi:hypothetical protein